jgi:hypothetical protein
MEAVTMLAKDEPLPQRYFDHLSLANGSITATATSGPTLS